MCFCPVTLFAQVLFGGDTGFRVILSNLTTTSVTVTIPPVTGKVEKDAVFHLRDATDNKNWVGGDTWADPVGGFDFVPCCTVKIANGTITKTFTLKPQHIYNIDAMVNFESDFQDTDAIEFNTGCPDLPAGQQRVSGSSCDDPKLSPPGTVKSSGSSGSNDTGSNSTSGGTQNGNTLDVKASGLNLKLSLDNPVGDIKTIPDFVEKCLTAVMLLLSPIIVIMILYSGFLFVTAQGNSEKLQTAKSTILYALIGAAIIIGAKGFSTVVASFFSHS
ncbi:MAG: hypothetical protein WCG55_02755 [bacterium]